MPLLSKNKDEFQAIADKYHVQIRGAHGEHTETDDGIFDISNKRRLGMSMTMLVQDMYDGVKAMIKREMELKGGSAPAKQEAAKPAAAAAPAAPEAPAGKPVKAGPHLKNPEDITGFVEFPAGTKSLLSKYLTPETYEAYKGKKDSCGVSFERMILSGAQNIDSGIGVYAGCHKSYYEMEKLFDPIILDYHGHKKTDKHVSNMDHTQLNCPPFTAEEAALVQSTRIRVGRNLADFPLGPGISKEERDKVESLVSGVLSKMTGELKGSYYPLKGMNKEV